MVVYMQVLVIFVVVLMKMEIQPMKLKLKLFWKRMIYNVVPMFKYFIPLSFYECSCVVVFHYYGNKIHYWVNLILRFNLYVVILNIWVIRNTLKYSSFIPSYSIAFIWTIFISYLYHGPCQRKARRRQNTSRKHCILYS